eukprot:Platyproteum_vivax@DN14343_c0_g1_i1.p1
MENQSAAIDVSGDGGVLKELITSGEGETPQDGFDVTVHYTGTLEDGTKFDSSRDRDSPFKFQLGVGQVIKGWDVGVKSMQKNERAKFTIKSDYGYGSSGAGPTIPPNATLIFDVELINFAPGAPKKRDRWSMSNEENMQAATEAKERGNAEFKKGDYAAATAAYREVGWIISTCWPDQLLSRNNLLLPPETGRFSF